MRLSNAACLICCVIIFLKIFFYLFAIKDFNFLNIQKHGQSQTEINALFDDALARQCGANMGACGSGSGPYIYLDDVIFSGARVAADLRDWVVNTAPMKATVLILVIAAHELGEWQCIERLKKVALETKKDIKFLIWASSRYENRRANKNYADVLWPASLPNDAALAAYMALDEKWPFDPRVANSVSKNQLFSSEAGRGLMEQELLLAGVRIRAACREPSPVIRPLGFSGYGLGFGSTIVTYRNCPNNAPLALWWGDATATSGAMHWYPLLPRKTYAQSDALADFDFDL